MTIAVLDACVLYPPSLRDLLMWLATVGAYKPRLTEEIHAEWMRNVLADSPEVTRGSLDRARHLMNQVAPDCVVSGYAEHMSSITLPDVNDRHVVAAAIHAGADVIVTYNTSDFPADILLLFGIKPAHPDDFLSLLLDDDSELFLRAVRAHRTSLKNPPKSSKEYIQTLRTNRLTWLAARMEAYNKAI